MPGRPLCGPPASCGPVSRRIAGQHPYGSMIDTEGASEVRSAGAARSSRRLRCDSHTRRRQAARPAGRPAVPSQRGGLGRPPGRSLVVPPASVGADQHPGVRSPVASADRFGPRRARAGRLLVVGRGRRTRQPPVRAPLGPGPGPAHGGRFRRGGKHLGGRPRIVARARILGHRRCRADPGRGRPADRDAPRHSGEPHPRRAGAGPACRRRARADATGDREPVARTRPESADARALPVRQNGRGTGDLSRGPADRRRRAGARAGRRTAGNRTRDPRERLQHRLAGRVRGSAATVLDTIGAARRRHRLHRARRRARTGSTPPSYSTQRCAGTGRRDQRSRRSREVRVRAPSRPRRRGRLPGRPDVRQSARRDAWRRAHSATGCARLVAAVAGARRHQDPRYGRRGGGDVQVDDRRTASLDHARQTRRTPRRSGRCYRAKARARR